MPGVDNSPSPQDNEWVLLYKIAQSVWRESGPGSGDATAANQLLQLTQETTTATQTTTTATNTGTIATNTGTTATNTGTTATGIGAPADAAVTDGSNGSVIAQLKGLTTILGDAWDNAGNQLNVHINSTNPALGTGVSTFLAATASAGSGTGYTALPTSTCVAVEIINNTGTALEFRRGAGGNTYVVPDLTSKLFVGITNANQIDFRRQDTSTNTVTIRSIEAYA